MLRHTVSTHSSSLVWHVFQTHCASFAAEEHMRNTQEHTEPIQEERSQKSKHLGLLRGTGVDSFWQLRYIYALHWWAEFHLDFQIGAITAIHAIPVNTRSRNSCNSSSYYSYSALNEQRIAGIAAVSRVTQARLQRAHPQRTQTRTRMHPQLISCLALCSTHQHPAQQRQQRHEQRVTGGRK